jgi:signal transduction histidine kinase
VYGLAISLAVSLAVSLPYFAPDGASSLVVPGSPYDHVQTIVSALAIAVIPVCVTIAVVREQLFDIDVVIGRTLVYATLTLVVALVYLGVVAGAGALLGGSGDTVLPLLAAAVVAVLFQPVRAVLQRRVRRLLYGMQDEPYEALSGLGRRLAATLPEEDIEARVVSTVRETLRVPYVAIAQRRDDGYVITREAGNPTANRLTLPLVDQGEEVGLLLVDDEPGRRLTEPGRALLADLARQAGPAVHGVRLTENLRTAVEQLQAARERLVVAGEEERRRMRRNLHDELAPTLAAARLTASTAAELVGRDPSAAVRALDRLQANLLAGVDDIRRLVDELRPVSLDERGLVGAIRERAGALRGQVSVTVEETAPLPELPAAVEVAAYRICQEALMNVLKHAAATTCTVRLGAADGHLELEVADDGVGALPVGGSGVGLASMRERAAELGGECAVSMGPGVGTRVAVRLPLRPAEA